MKRNRTFLSHTACMVDGVDCDVAVDYRILPAEPDVNYHGGIEIVNVWFEDEGDIMDRMSNDELEDLEDLIAAGEQPDDEGERVDHAYQEWKDRRLEDR